MARYLIETSSTDGYQLEDASGVLLVETPTGLVHGPGPGSVHGPAGGGMVHAKPAPILIDTKFSALPASIATLFGDNEWLAINESGTTKRLCGSCWKKWAGNTVRNNSVGNQTPTTADTYLTGSKIYVPPSGLVAGAWFRWTLIYGKTAAGTSARVVKLWVGTAGTVTDDATIATYTSGTPSAAADVGWHQFTVILRTTGAAATTNVAERYTHNLSTTGLTNANEAVVTQAAGSTFNSATPNLIFGVSATTGSGETLTVYQVLSEAYNL